MANTAVKIPEKHYVALQSRNTSECPVGFLVPWGTDAAAQKRMSTADTWAGQSWGSSSSLKAKTINNDLMSGFVLADDPLRHSRSNVVWRVVDPRGFELEINCENMANLIRLTTIENGEILSRCVWARQGANNVLLPEEAEEYQDALKNTERVKTSVSIRDVSVGDKILLQNGEEVVYLGKLYTLFQEWGDQHETDGEGISFSDKKRHYFYADRIDHNWRCGPAIKSVSSTKISSIVEASFMEIEDTAAFINDKIQAFEAQIVSLRNDHDYRFIGVTENRMNQDNISTVLEEIDGDITTVSEKVKETAEKNEIYLHSVSFIARMISSPVTDGPMVRVNPERNHHYGHKNNNKDFHGSVLYHDRLMNESRFVTKTESIGSGYRGSHNQTITKDLDASEAEWFWPKIAITDPKTGKVVTLRMI